VDPWHRQRLCQRKHHSSKSVENNNLPEHRAGLLPSIGRVELPLALHKRPEAPGVFPKNVCRGVCGHSKATLVGPATTLPTAESVQTIVAGWHHPRGDHIVNPYACM
jgi:hypothetical protein